MQKFGNSKRALLVATAVLLTFPRMAPLADYAEKKPEYARPAAELRTGGSRAGMKADFIHFDRRVEVEEAGIVFASPDPRPSDSLRDGKSISSAMDANTKSAAKSLMFISGLITLFGVMCEISMRREIRKKLREVRLGRVQPGSQEETEAGNSWNRAMRAIAGGGAGAFGGAFGLLLENWPIVAAGFVVGVFSLYKLWKEVSYIRRD